MAAVGVRRRGSAAWGFRSCATGCCGSMPAAPTDFWTAMVLPDGPNQRWSLDFVSDSLICGRRFRILCVVDDYTRECLALVADTSLSGARVARELTGLMGIRGKPHTV